MVDLKTGLLSAVPHPEWALQGGRARVKPGARPPLWVLGLSLPPLPTRHRTRKLHSQNGMQAGSPRAAHHAGPRCQPDVSFLTHITPQTAARSLPLGSSEELEEAAGFHSGFMSHAHPGGQPGPSSPRSCPSTAARAEPSSDCWERALHLPAAGLWSPRRTPHGPRAACLPADLL